MLDAWIESHQELGRHHKTRKLAHLLNISLPTTVGHLHFFWWWALDYSNEGDVSRFDAFDIASAAEWEGDPEAFLSALLTAGFVERTSDGALVIHDWMQYAGKLLQRRREDAERKRAMRSGTPRGGQHTDTARRPQDVQRTSSGRPDDGVRNRNPNPNQSSSEDTVASTFADEASDEAPFCADAHDRVAADAAEFSAVPARGDLSNVSDETLDALPTPADTSAHTADAQKPTPARRATNPLWDALVEIFGYEPRTKSERSNWGGIVKDLKAANATADELRLCKQHYDEAVALDLIHWNLTPNAFPRHFAELLPSPRASPLESARAASAATTSSGAIRSTRAAGHAGNHAGNRAGNGGTSHGTPAAAASRAAGINGANGANGRGRTGIATSAERIADVIANPGEYSATEVARAHARRAQLDAQAGVGAPTSTR